MSRPKGMCMTTDADIRRQVSQDELEFQVNTAKARLELLANRAEGTMVKAEVEAYETLSPKLQAIHQKFQELKKATGAQWEQTKGDLQGLVADLSGVLYTLISLQEIGERGRVGRRTRRATAHGIEGAVFPSTCAA